MYPTEDVILGAADVELAIFFVATVPMVVMHSGGIQMVANMAIQPMDGIIFIIMRTRMFILVTTSPANTGIRKNGVVGTQL